MHTVLLPSMEAATLKISLLIQNCENERNAIVIDALIDRLLVKKYGESQQAISNASWLRSRLKSRLQHLKRKFNEVRSYHH